jgi:hypothetical protein
MTGVDNIAATLTLATDADRREGLGWYASANIFAQGLAAEYGITVRQAAGIIAALSPRLSWTLNMRFAHQLCATGDAPVLTLSKRRARAILAGADPSDVLAAPKGSPRSGQKVRAFFALIADPASAHDVCIDRHAYDVWAGDVGDDTTRKVLDRAGVYDAVAADYRAVADAHDMLPHQVQAITWNVWKRTKPYDRPQHRALFQRSERSEDRSLHQSA